MRTLPNHLIRYFDAMKHLIQEDKLQAFADDLIDTNNVASLLGGALVSRQIIATIALPYLLKEPNVTNN